MSVNSVNLVPKLLFILQTNYIEFGMDLTNMIKNDYKISGAKQKQIIFVFINQTFLVYMVENKKWAPIIFFFKQLLPFYF